MNNCPQCGEFLLKGKSSCECGWNQGKQTEKPPLVEHELMKVLGKYMARRQLPYFMPTQPIEAARWWIEQQEPGKSDEAPRQVSIPGSDDARRWICPYHNRLVYTLWKFLHQPFADQKLILAAREDKIFWRGDEMKFFMLLIEEVSRMRKIGIDAYRNEALKKMKELNLLQ